MHPNQGHRRRWKKWRWSWPRVVWMCLVAGTCLAVAAALGLQLLERAGILVHLDKTLTLYVIHTEDVAVMEACSGGDEDNGVLNEPHPAR